MCLGLCRGGRVELLKLNVCGRGHTLRLKDGFEWHRFMAQGELVFKII